MSPLVMVTVVIGGSCHGSIGDDGAVGAVRVRGRAGDVVQEVVRVWYVTLGKGGRVGRGEEEEDK